MTVGADDGVAPLFRVTMEPRENWLIGASLLVATLRMYGRPYEAAPVEICVPVSDRYAGTRIPVAGINIVGVPIHPVLPYLNKLSSLGAEVTTASHVVLLDCDVAVLDLRTLPENLDTHPRARRKYKRHLRRVIAPDYDRVLSPSGYPNWRPCAYYNTGVVVTPIALREELIAGWEHWAGVLAQEYQGHPLADQVGYSRAVTQLRPAGRTLPDKLNVTPGMRFDRSGAGILHYSSTNIINVRVRDYYSQSRERLDEFLRSTEHPLWTDSTHRLRAALASQTFSDTYDALREGVGELGLMGSLK